MCPAPALLLLLLHLPQLQYQRQLVAIPLLNQTVARVAINTNAKVTGASATNVNPNLLPDRQAAVRKPVIGPTVVRVTIRTSARATGAMANAKNTQANRNSVSTNRGSSHLKQTHHDTLTSREYWMRF